YLPSGWPGADGSGRRRAGVLQQHAEADAVVPRAPAPVRRAKVEAVVLPAPAAEDAVVPPVRPGRIDVRGDLVIVAVPPVGAPLPDVAVHVEKAPGVGRVAAYGAGPPQVRALRRAAEGLRAVETGHLRGDAFAEVIAGGGACAAGVFPLRLGGQAVGP